MKIVSNDTLSPGGWMVEAGGEMDGRVESLYCVPEHIITLSSNWKLKFLYGVVSSHG